MHSAHSPCQHISIFIYPNLYAPFQPEGLGSNVPPQIDYRAFLNKLWEAMPAESFVSMALDAKVLGNPRLKTQHLVGAAKWVKTGEAEITGYHQMRVAHQRYSDDQLTKVAVKGHAHGKGTVWYRKVGGVWKFAGIEPDIRWSEYDHDKIFEEGEEKYGEVGR